MKIALQEKKYQGLPYLYQKKGADSLIIVFSAFTGEKRRYNYVKSFKSLNCDKLYILDPWGYLGSYNLYEKGKDVPLKTTQSLINQIVIGGGYKRVFTVGSSKGGTCAIYYGLTVGAEAVFTGACQYNLGTYLWREEFRRIFYGMMGENAGLEEVSFLNDLLRKILRDSKGTHTVVHVIYSKKELTYERQIVDLLHDLKEYGIPFRDVECDFEKHEEVSVPFVKYVNDYFMQQ